MRPWERRAFNATAAIVSISGFVYIWMKYFVQSDDPFAVINHPWQPTVLAIHLLASPPFLLLFGIIFNSHIMRKLRGEGGRNRVTGLASLATFALMVLSGYLLQVSIREGWQQAVLALHITSGVVFTATYLAHLVISVRMARARVGSLVRDVA